MPSPTSDPNQPDKATKGKHDGWITRAQVAAELGYRSIFPVRKMEGQQLHPVRASRGWLFDPAEVAAIKAKRPLGEASAPTSDGRIAGRVFRMFDSGRELREIVEELELAPGVVRELWHEWLTDLDEGEANRRKTVLDERRRRTEEDQKREVERLEQHEQQNFEKIMAALNINGGQTASR